jgi:hypothetical protein
MFVIRLIANLLAMSLPVTIGLALSFSEALSNPQTFFIAISNK